MNIRLWLLALCQGLLLTNNVVFIAINGLVGLQLTPYSWMATLPVMGYVVGGAISTPLVAVSQARWGRRASFQLGLVVAFVSAGLCAWAAFSGSFWLLCSATVIAGYYNANGQLYRFAAAELAAPAFREKAVSLVLAGGLLGAVAGPNLASGTRTLLAVPFAGAYIALMAVALFAMVCMAGVKFDEVAPPAPGSAAPPAGRSLGQLMRQPTFAVAVVGAALGYGVMNLLMAATPLAMQVHGYSFDSAALVLEWHVIGMFAPGFFTGHLIQRFGTLQVMLVGVLLNLVCVGIALSGQEIHHFTAALFLLGVGWNFLFTGSTTLAISAYRSEEKNRAQGGINFFVFATMAVTSLASGALVTTSGWWWLNVVSLVPLLLTGAALLWLMAHQRRPGALARAGG